MHLLLDLSIQNHFLRLPVCPSVLFSCFQPTGGNFWDIVKKFYTSMYFGTGKKAIENSLDPFLYQFPYNDFSKRHFFTPLWLIITASLCKAFNDDHL